MSSSCSFRIKAEIWIAADAMSPRSRSRTFHTSRCPSECVGVWVEKNLEKFMDDFQSWFDRLACKSVVPIFTVTITCEMEVPREKVSEEK